MLTVADYELIRRKFYLDGMSQRSIADELGHSRKTVGKAVAHAGDIALDRAALQHEARRLQLVEALRRARHRLTRSL